MDARTRKNQFDERKQDWPGKKFGLWWLERFDVIQAEPSFLLFTQEDKWILCSQGGKRRPQQSITVVATGVKLVVYKNALSYTTISKQCVVLILMSMSQSSPSSAYRILLKYAPRRLLKLSRLKCGAYSMAVSVWKLDSTKNCILELRYHYFPYWTNWINVFWFWLY